jgi:DNA-binding CsgD family transcriptional regulator
LEPGEQDLLGLVAMHEPLGAAELAALADTTEMDSLERRAVVVSRLDGRRLQVWLAHPLYGEVAREGVTAERYRELARRRAEVIERLGLRRRDDTLVVATWRVAAGGGDPDLLQAGAQIARARNDPSLTTQLADAAIAAGAGFEARFLAAEAAFLQGRADNVDAQLADLRRLGTTDGERARVAALEADTSLFLRGAPDLSVLDAVEAVVTDPLWREELLSRRMTILWLTDGQGAAAKVAETLLTSETLGASSFACLLGAYALASTGRITDGLRLIDRTVPELVGPTTAGPWYAGTRHNVRTLVLVSAGRLAEADSSLTPTHEQATTDGDDELQAFTAVALSTLRLAQGRVRTAALHAAEAINRFERLRRLPLLRQPIVNAAVAAALTRDPASGAAWLAKLDTLGLPPFVDDSDLVQARAWIAVAEGDIRRASELLEHAAATAERVGNLIGAVALWHDVARLGRAKQAQPGLAAIIDAVEGDLAAVRMAHVGALVGRDPDALEDVGRRFEALGAKLLSAEAFSEAAVLLKRAERGRDASAVAQHAARVAGQCEGATTPALRGVDIRAPLAPGELETARLAAAGHSNRAIADMLHLSIRTVENRLQRSYEKLGVSGRRALAEALEQFVE